MILSSRWTPQRSRWMLAVAGVLLVAAGTLAAQDKAPKKAPAGAPVDTAAKPVPADSAPLPMAQIEALVAPIALYPDPLLAQTLVASTYPLEIVQLQQWMAKHPNLKDKALVDSVAKQPWDPSIQSMAAVPEVVKRLADDIQWTTELGNAFLAQQEDVMTAVQAMRKKAVDKGALTSNEHQVVDTQVVEKQTVIVVQPTNPEVVYVPSYSPTVVYGPPVYPYYPYPPIYYPPYPPGAAFVSFSIGVMWGAAIWGGPCCGAGWGGNNVYINHNHFNQINNINGGGRGNNNWQHNPSHRGGTPYPNNRTADRFGGQGGGRQGVGAAQRPAGSGGARPSAGTRPAGGAGQGGRISGGGARPSAGTQPAGGAGQRGGAADRVPSASTRPSGGTNRDQVGNRNVPSSRGGQSGFSGGQGGYSGSSARASSARGSSSMGGRSGGFSGGGGRGGGGGRRR